MRFVPGVLFMLVVVAHGGMAHGQTVVVNTAADSVDGDTSSAAALNAAPGFDGVIGIWEAITAANNTPGSGLVTIQLAAGLTVPISLFLPPPTITRVNVALVGDGTNGFAGGVSGNIHFSNPGPAAVRDLRFDNFFSALEFTGVGGGAIEGCVFGNVSPNFSSIVLTNCQDVVIGGAGPGQGNVVVNDPLGGIAVEGGANNVVEGNFVGTDAAGTAGLGCGQGISVASGAAGTIVRGNTVASNSQVGISITNLATGTVVVGNRIGVGPDGVTALGNALGVQIDLGAVSSVVGGLAPGAANTIAHNTAAGIDVAGVATLGHTLRGNVLFDNGAGGPGDAVRLAGDANNGMPAPALTSVSPVAMGTAAPGSTVDLYADAPGGQARVYLETLTGDAGSGAFAGSIALDSSVYEGWNITAMATLAQDTSELATSLAVPATPPTVLGISRTTPQDPTNLPEVGFEVVFSEPVSGIETGVGIVSDDFALTDSVGATIAAVAGSGDTYTVTVGTGAVDGGIRLDVLSGGGIEDSAGLPLATDYTDGPAYTMLRLKFLANLVAPAPVPEGGSVTLSVEVEAPGNVSYQWFQDTGAKAPLPVGTDAPALVLSPISVLDAGDYYVEVTAGPEVLASNVVTVVVLEVEGLPVGGAAGLAMLAASLSAVALRRRRS